MKEAEENHALIEEQIQQLFQTIQKRYQPDEPISFLYLVLSPEPEGIVRTLLYLLQLVNRKKLKFGKKFLKMNPKVNQIYYNMMILA